MPTGKVEPFRAGQLLTNRKEQIMRTLSIVLLSLAMAAWTSRAIADQPFRTDINPALQYYQALLVAPDLSQPDRDYLFSQNWRGKKLPDRFGQLLNRYDNQFRLVRQARHATIRADWGIDMSPGPATLLPQLSRVKGI